MAHNRTGTGPWVWLKGVGTQEEPLSRDWRLQDDHLLRKIWFSRHPRSVRAGDLLVYYAVGWQALPAIVQVASDQVEDEREAHPTHGDRFRWAMRVRPILALDLDLAPRLAATRVASTRVRRLSHMLLNPSEYRSIHDLLTASIRAETAWSVTGPFPQPL
jgi:alkanesulfonate monooxygenase SsuD/methylene tetrahydromethanopterin reductase-like flavin-dependent oxidoreductase (luciferase family)